jgi:hypothetical protein
VRKLKLIAGNPLEKTENKTDPISAITNEKATKESTDKTASPTRFLLIPQRVAKIATKICTGKKTIINNNAPGKSVKKKLNAKTEIGRTTIIELVKEVDGLAFFHGY